MAAAESYQGHILSKNSALALEALAARVRAGEVTGVAFIAIGNQKSFEIGLTGSALTEPLRALGMLDFMKVELFNNIRRHLRVVK